MKLNNSSIKIKDVLNVRKNYILKFKTFINYIFIKNEKIKK